MLQKFFPESVVLFKVQPVYSVGGTPNNKLAGQSSVYILVTFAGYLRAAAHTKPTVPYTVKANVTLTAITATLSDETNFLKIKKFESTFPSIYVQQNTLCLFVIGCLTGNKCRFLIALLSGSLFRMYRPAQRCVPPVQNCTSVCAPSSKVNATEPM